MNVLQGEEAIINDKPPIYKCRVCHIEKEDSDGFLSHDVFDNGEFHRRFEFCSKDCYVTYHFQKLLLKLAKYKNQLGYVGMRILYIYVLQILKIFDTIHETDDDYAESVHLLKDWMKETRARNYMLDIRIIESISDKLHAMLYAVEDYPGFRLYHYGAKGRGPHMWQERYLSTEGNLDTYYVYCHEEECKCSECLHIRSWPFVSGPPLFRRSICKW